MLLFTMQSKGRLASPQALISRMRLSSSSSLTVPGFEDGGVAGGVADERGVTPAVEVVEQGELGAGVGAFPTNDHRVPFGQADRLTRAVRSRT